MPAPYCPPVAISLPFPFSSVMVSLPSPLFSRPACSLPLLRVFVPSSSMFTLPFPPVETAAPLVSIFTLEIVTFAVAFSDALIVMVLLVSAELLRCVITGASSGTAEPLPCVTVCPELSAFTVTLPSSRYQLAA